LYKIFFYYSHNRKKTEVNINTELNLLREDAPSTLVAASPKPVGCDSTDGDPSAK
jgi:hypothetical protein